MASTGAFPFPAPAPAPAFGAFGIFGATPSAAAPSSQSAGGGGAPEAAAAAGAERDTAPSFSRADLRALHEKPMREAWARHVAGAANFVKQEVLRAALAGATVYNNTCIVDAVPCLDAVLDAKAKSNNGALFGAPITGKALSPLDPKSGLLVSGYGTRIAEPCMADIVAALKAVFPDSRVSFAKAAPASGGKDVLTVAWD